MDAEMAWKTPDVAADNNYDQVGMVRFFGLGADGERLLSGWSTPEDNQNWNDGPEVGYQLRVSPPPQEACIIRIEGGPFVNEHAPRQTIEMYVNGLRLGWWSLTSAKRVVLEARIEPEQWLIRDGVAVGDVRWHIPQCVSPQQLGLGADERELGFCFISISVASA
ncbi:hypothetical protein [Acidocella sp.]|uniref:hypothetical protein n=2 Tax=Acidocella sp. TaxID=50710 RepID=UPI00262C0C9E|nr:hypothetical protein [Acidocella sp.]